MEVSVRILTRLAAFGEIAGIGGFLMWIEACS